MSYKERAQSWYKRAIMETDEFLKFVLLFIAVEALLEGQKIYALKTKPRLLETIDPKDISILREALDARPHQNMDADGDQTWNGRLESDTDWIGIILFLARARNNLFHGDKAYDEERDIFIVTYGNKMIEPIVKNLLS
ncbi:hypothetical protein K8Q94_03195 [Candidatus Nomurabacteria bacterium]|nr:hypothetical protein [Candidatus Nomurabacteria bacterium]